MAPRQRVMALVAVWFLLVLALFHTTVVDMVTLWANSVTFSHGFLILPISLWLLWQDRRRLAVIPVDSEPRALFLTLGAGLVWLLAYLVDVNVVQQLAMMTVLISGIWVLVGTPLARAMAFPLGFLFMAVPMGAGLIPPLMLLTADTTEYLVRASGVPVFREGMYLTLPTGVWSVIEECSGVRYLIASFTLGLVYAYISYQSLLRRALFVLAAIVVPILANSLRAWGLVMIGHYSDMRLGTGDDHLFYGWVLFGVVILLLFWVGSFWQEQTDEAEACRKASQMSARRGPAGSFLLLLLLVSITPGPLMAYLVIQPGERGAIPLSVPAAAAGWLQTAESKWRWQPAQYGADRDLVTYYAGAADVRLDVYQYLNQQPGMELVTPGQFWREDRKGWRVIDEGQYATPLGTAVDEAVLSTAAGDQRLLVWSWYRVMGRTTLNPYEVKVREALQLLSHGSREGARVYLSTPLSVGRAQSRAALQAFLADHWSGIERTLEQQ